MTVRMDQEAIQKQIMEIIQEMADLEQERGQGNKEIKKKRRRIDYNLSWKKKTCFYQGC